MQANASGPNKAKVLSQRTERESRSHPGRFEFSGVGELEGVYQPLSCSSCVVRNTELNEKLTALESTMYTISQK